MSGLSSAQFAAYARDQVRNADLILVRHAAHSTTCSCGRLLPCSVVTTVTGRRTHFIDALCRVAASRVIGRARHPGRE